MLAAKKTGNTSKENPPKRDKRTHCLKKPKTAELKLTHYSNGGHLKPSKTFFVTFFSATIDGRNLIFGHKLHIGMPYLCLQQKRQGILLKKILPSVTKELIQMWQKTVWKELICY
jgi:hypothetical protein